MLDNNGFWIFLGIIVGAVVQFLFQKILQYDQRRNAIKLLKIEVDINKGALERLEAQLERTKTRIGSGQVSEDNLFIDFSEFIYRIADPLINSGYFHLLLDAEGVKAYFKFVNELNYQKANDLTIILREKHIENGSMEFMEWLIDTKIIEWKSWLETLEHKLH
jgi:hypothetical protein